MKNSITKKAQRSISLLFFVLFSLALSYLIINVIFNNQEYKWPVLYILPLMIAALAVFYFGFKCLKKHESFLQKHYYVILFVFAGIMLILQIVFGLALEFKPAYDMSAIYDGAIEWLNTGTFANQYEYMYYFPNNIGAMAFLKLVFSAAHLLGINRYFVVGIVINSFMSAAMICVVSLTLKHLAGHIHAVFALLIFALSLPFYFIGAAFYTDALSMLFPALMYYFYVLYREADTPKKHAIYALLLGVSAAVGMLIKFTVVIMLVAIIIECILRFDFTKIKSAASRDNLKNHIVPIMAAILVIILIPSIFNTYIYGKHLSREQAEIQNTPVSHWVMMSLYGSGRNNDPDYKFTRSFDDPVERNKEINARIVERVKEKGAVGMAEHLTNKIVICFGDGTYALSDFLDDRPKHDTALHDYLLYKGEHYKSYATLCSAILYSIFVLALFGALKYLLSRQKNIPATLAPYIAFFGIWLFLIFWEASGRYFSNFVPIIFICAALGTEYFVAALSSLCRRLSSSFKNTDNTI